MVSNKIKLILVVAIILCVGVSLLDISTCNRETEVRPSTPITDSLQRDILLDSLKMDFIRSQISKNNSTYRESLNKKRNELILQKDFIRNDSIVRRLAERLSQDDSL